MKSQLARKILEECPKELRDKIIAYGDALVKEHKEREGLGVSECKDHNHQNKIQIFHPYKNYHIGEWCPSCEMFL